MLKTNFSGNNKICGALPPGGYGFGRGTKKIKGWKPLVYERKREWERSETSLSNLRQYNGAL